MNYIIKNAVILPMDGGFGEKYFTGTIGIAADKVAFVCNSLSTENPEQQFRDRYAEIEEIDGTGKLVMPGLVNIHNHVSMTLMRGYADDLALMEWLNGHIWPFEAKLHGDDIRLGAELGIAEMLLGGTTTFVDMYWQELEVGKAVENTGIRAVLSPTFTDTRFDEFGGDFRATFGKYGTGQHPRISLMIAPHSVYSCCRENLTAARDMAAAHGLGLNIHVSETMDEQDTMRERIGMTPVEYLDELGMLLPSTLIVHGVYLNESDMDILRQRGCAVAHNPHSNVKLASGIAPVARMVEKGINVGIGTDGPSSNNDLDMWEELRTASFLQKVATGDPTVLPAYQTLEMATVNGAKALGMEDRIGSIKPGMLADLIMLDIEKPHMYPRHDLVANLVYCAKCSDVDTVFVGGEMVVRGGKCLRVDESELCRSVQERISEIALR